MLWRPRERLRKVELGRDSDHDDGRAGRADGLCDVRLHDLCQLFRLQPCDRLRQIGFNDLRERFRLGDAERLRCVGLADLSKLFRLQPCDRLREVGFDYLIERLRLQAGQRLRYVRLGDLTDHDSLPNTSSYVRKESMISRTILEHLIGIERQSSMLLRTQITVNPGVDKSNSPIPSKGRGGIAVPPCPDGQVHILTGRGSGGCTTRHGSIQITLAHAAGIATARNEVPVVPAPSIRGGNYVAEAGAYSPGDFNARVFEKLKLYRATVAFREKCSDVRGINQSTPRHSYKGITIVNGRS